MDFQHTFIDHLDEDVAYTVDVEDGWVSVSEESRFGKDVLSTISPRQARQIARAMLDAADVAENHLRWNEDSAHERIKAVALKFAAIADDFLHAVTQTETGEEEIFETKAAHAKMLALISELGGR